MNTHQKTKILFSAENLEVGYKLNGNSSYSVLTDLNLELNSGELTTFIGPNGSGKSTLIKSLIGLVPKLNGELFYREINLDSYTFYQRAQCIGVVLTNPVYEQNMTVEELVSLGRFPHTNWLGRLTSSDKKAINEAIHKVGLSSKHQSRLGALSDGERQRAMFARVLAQDVELIILDEPTAHLDLPNRMEILLLLKNLAHEFGKGVLLSTHELGLALQVSDKVWLINNEKQLVSEIPEQLILSGVLDQTFGNEKIAFHPWSASFELVPGNKKKVYIKGMGMLQACVVRLFKRLGLVVEYESNQCDITIEVNEENEEITVLDDKKYTFNSLLAVQNFLIETLCIK